MESDYGIKIFFTGSAEKKLDQKGRIYIPAVYINQLTHRVLHITRGEDRNLFVYPSEIFIEKAAILARSYGFKGQPDKNKRIYFQETMSDAHPVKCDDQGRILIPKPFLDFAQIQDTVLIIGAYDQLILWNPDAFKQFIQSSELKEDERVHRFGWGDEPVRSG